MKRQIIEKKAKDLKAGDVLNRWGVPCKVLTVEKCKHPLGMDQVKLTTQREGAADDSHKATLGFRPEGSVSVFA